MGTYVLALWLDAPRSLSIGRLGEFAFPAGWYLYAGSALGPGGLPARVGRHAQKLGPDKRPHWHVDYVREAAVWGGVWACGSGRRLECTWAAALRRLPGAVLVVRGLGASDCDCPAHLVHVPALPGEDWFAATLGAERMTVGQDEIQELLEILVSGDEDSREAAAIALGRFGTAAAGPLADMLDGEDADARWWAARALAEVGRDGGVPPLVGALEDADPDVRACAALALGHVGNGAAAATLAECLGDESAFVASIAADALGMIGEDAVGALAAKLTDERPHTRLLAVRALGRIKSERAIAPLFGVLEDSSYLVRHYAREALEALGVGMIYVAP